MVWLWGGWAISVVRQALAKKPEVPGHDAVRCDGRRRATRNCDDRRRRARSADDQPFRRGARRLLHRIDTTRGYSKADHIAGRDPHQSTRCERGARCAQRLLRRDSLAAGKPLYAARGDAELSACQAARILSSHACAAHAVAAAHPELQAAAAADGRERRGGQSRSVASSSQQPAEVEPSSQQPSVAEAAPSSPLASMSLLSSSARRGWTAARRLRQ